VVLLNWVYWLIGVITPVVLRYLLNGVLVIIVMSMLLLLMEILAVVIVFCNCILIVSYINVCLCVCTFLCLFYISVPLDNHPQRHRQGGTQLPERLMADLCVRTIEFLPCTHMVGTRGQEYLLNCNPQGGYLNFGTCFM
jgi:hypothetical protein